MLLRKEIAFKESKCTNSEEDVNKYTVLRCDAKKIIRKSEMKSKEIELANERLFVDLKTAYNTVNH